MVAHLSKGKDEIFDPEYIPSKSIAKEMELQMAKKQPILFANIPAHLQAKGSGRSLKLHQMTKAEKIQAQLEMAEMRIAKQNAQKEQLKKQLEVFNHQNDDEIAQMIEREKIRAEVAAEMKAQAQQFVNEQIQQAHAQMYQEIERQVAARVNANRQDPPLSQNRNPDYEPS
jgi:septal ring factor EnvC (AmiA/AmiB activator)